MLDCIPMITGIIPAAGTSSRMGVWKPMLEVSGKPMIFHVIEALISVTSAVIIVTGYRGDELESVVAPQYPGIRFARNYGYQRGMFSSIQTGMRLLGDAEVFLIVHADMPLLRHTHIASLLSYWESLTDAADVLRPYVDGVPGHPVVCRRSVAETALGEQAHASMEQVLSRHAVTLYHASDPAYTTDIDTPEAFLRL